MIEQKRLLASFAAFSYALAPRAIVFARTELLHTFETTLLLLAVVAFIPAVTSNRQRRRLGLLALTGLIIGLNFGVHEESIFIFPSFLLFLFGYLYTQQNRTHENSLKNFILSITALSVPFVIVISLLGFWPILIRHLASGSASSASASDVSLLVYYMEIVRGAILLNTSSLFFVLFNLVIAGSVVAFLVKLPNLKSSYIKNNSLSGKSKFIVELRYLPFMIVASYILLYPMASGSYIFPRLFLPILPLLFIIFYTYLTQLLLHIIFERKSVIVVAVSFFLVVGANFFFYFPTTKFMFEAISEQNRPLFKMYGPYTIPIMWKDRLLFRNYDISEYRQAYNVLENRIDEHNKLLVIPHVISGYEGRKGFNHYFGDNAKYIKDCGKSLYGYIENNNITYLIAARFHYKHSQVDAPCLGINKNDYSLNREMAVLDKLIVSKYKNIEKRYEGGSFSIFELSPAQSTHF